MTTDDLIRRFEDLVAAEERKAGAQDVIADRLDDIVELLKELVSATRG